MPELPEAEIARLTLEGGALHRMIVDVDDRDDWVCRPHQAGEIADALRGRRFTEATRIGKFIALATGGPRLGLHLGMAGRIDVDAEPSPNGWDRFAVEFEGGGRMALFDKRRLSRAVLEPDHTHLGPDAGEATRPEFRAAVGDGSAPIKARLLDQGAVAGVGNLLADEGLWRARIDPRRPSGGLGDDLADRLRRELRAAIREAIADGGVHTLGFVQERRSGGCPRCGAELRRAKVGGRTTYWCPVEQR